ncbi:MAG: hypothetical protein AAFP70_05760 [Calditrichota bacterium]
MESLNKLIHENYDALSQSIELPILNYPYLFPKEAEELKALTNHTIDETQNLPAYKNFKQVNVNIISQIRLYIANDRVDENITQWCRKALRYIEVRYSSLKENEKKAGRKSEDTIKIFNQIMALFIEYYLKTSDIIYLNTALKVLDLSWIMPPSSKRPAYIATQTLYDLNRQILDKILYQIEHD